MGAIKASSIELMPGAVASARPATARPPCVPEKTELSSRARAPEGRLTFDAEYVQKLAEGDQRVEGEFYEYFRPLIEIKLRRRLGASEDVRDLCHETFRRVLTTVRAGDGVRFPERFGGFVAGVCENVLREHRKKHQTVPLEWAMGELWTGGPESELVRSELANLVRRTLDALPDLDRALLHALFLEERSREEVCKRFGVQRDYLRVLLHRAKTRFRTHYRLVRQ